MPVERRPGTGIEGFDGPSFADLGLVLASAHASVALRGTARPGPRRTTAVAIDSPLRQLRAGIADAHDRALVAHGILQRRALRRLALVAPDAPRAAGGTVSSEEAFKPLARSTRTELNGDDLARLGCGDVGAVFGAGYDQDGCNPDVRLDAEGWPLVGVTRLALRGGARGLGELRAACAAAVEPSPDWTQQAVEQGARLLAMYLGLHLCLADAGFVVVARGTASSLPRPHGGGAGQGELRVEVVDVDLVPRPHLQVDAELRVDGRPAGGVRGLVLEVRERDGRPVGPDAGGRVRCFLGRKGADSVPVMLSEFHMAHFARGDQGVALGPEFARYSGRRATRLPSGGLLLVDRVVTVDGERGRLSGGATHLTEYDSPADAWYYQDTANASMPNCVYMETSLQSALMVGYYLGATLSEPDTDYSLRNLGGTATLLRELDTRDTTLRQWSQLLSTTSMPGSILQSFAYRSAVDGEDLYQGESLFGYFSQDALANQTGLDGGRRVDPWLSDQRPAPEVRTVDIADRRRRAAGGVGPACAKGHLALLDEMQVVDGGGRHGLGYLHARREIDPAAWFFARHFHLDPVVPGSLGVESVIQALQEWMVDGGLADGLESPEFVVPVGIPFSWKYRGQILPTDQYSALEVHVKDVARRPGRVRVVADASVWKPGLRIYELTDLAVELRTAGAHPW